MTWDPVRQRIVLFGGDMPGSWPQVRADTWDWDGSTWLRLQPAASPPPRMGHAMAYDERSERLLLFGGQGVTAGDDTWSFGLPAGAAAQPAGLACHGSRGLPVLSGSLPHLGNTGLVVDLLEVPARSPCVFGFSPAMQARPIGSGCTLYLGDPIVPLFTVTSATGFASVRCAVPLDVRLRGEVLFAQAFALDAGAALGVVFSAARVMTLGD
jgi:hypothetical protein